MCKLDLKTRTFIMKVITGNKNVQVFACVKQLATQMLQGSVLFMKLLSARNI